MSLHQPLSLFLVIFTKEHLRQFFINNSYASFLRLFKKSFSEAFSLCYFHSFDFSLIISCYLPLRSISHFLIIISSFNPSQPFTSRSNQPIIYGLCSISVRPSIRPSLCPSEFLLCRSVVHSSRRHCLPCSPEAQPINSDQFCRRRQHQKRRLHRLHAFASISALDTSATNVLLY